MEIPIGPMALASDEDDLGAARGVIVGVVLAMPLWILIGVALFAVFREGPAGEITGLGSTFAKICAAFLMSSVA